VKNWQSGGDLMDTPPNVQSARAFRERWNFDNRRVLVAQIVERHLRCRISDQIERTIMTLCLCREIIPLCGAELNFRNLIGTTRAFPDFGKVFGDSMSVQPFASRRRHQSIRSCQKQGTPKFFDAATKCFAKQLESSQPHAIIR
jgi:hypothetical protein